MNDHRDDQPRDGQPNWPTGGDPDAGSHAPGTPPDGTQRVPGPARPVARGGPGTPGGPTGGPSGGPRPGGPGGPGRGGPGFPQRPGGPARPGGPGFNQGPPRPAERATDHMPPVPDPAKTYQREPDLLTHRDDDYLMESEMDAYDDESDGLTPEELKLRKRRKAWRWVRRVLYVLIFLGVTGPVAAFYLIYQNVTVPDPQTVALGQAQPVTIYYADGSVMEKIDTGARIFIKSDQIPINVRHAVEAAEDETFETNNGFDMRAIMRTAFNQLTGGTGGGSTITQEYIKVATNSKAHTLTRKVNEVVEAYKMTKTYTNKNDILAAYLNTVYFGNGANGIETAARTYFGVPAAQLTPEQSALLAGLIQLPGDANDVGYQHRRFTYVWGRMAVNHWITQAQFQAGKFPTPLANPGQSGSIPWDRQLIVTQVEDELAKAGWDLPALKTHGAQIYTTIDPKAMAAAENSMSSHLASDAQFMNKQPIVLHGKTVTPDGQPVGTPIDRVKGDPSKGTYPDPAVKGTEAAALVSINPATGEVIAYYGGNDKNYTQLDMANTPHPAGSSFKPYVFAAGLEYMPSKIGLNSIYDGTTSPQTIEGFQVHNAEGDTCDNPCTVKSAMTNSLNVVFYMMGSQVGSSRVRDAALQAGIAPTMYNPLDGKMEPSLLHPGEAAPEGGIAIGQYPVRPIDQAQGYATFANNGNYIPAHFVKRVTDNTGVTLFQFDVAPKPAFGNDPANSQAIAKTVSDSLTDIAKSSFFPLAKNRPADAKTGTQDYKAPNGLGLNLNYNSDGWTVGYTPQVVTAVWFGHFDNPGPTFGAGNNPGPGPKTGYNVFGREDPGQIWKTYMDSYLNAQPVMQFPTTPADIGGSWDFIHNVDASTENQPPANPQQQPTGPQQGGPPPQTSDQPTGQPTTDTTKHHPPPTSTICNPIIQPCGGGGGGGGGGGPAPPGG